jgi:hypothetical protein
VLKLDSIANQVDRMAEAHQLRERIDYLEPARDLLRRIDPATLAAKIESRTRTFPWLVAVPLNSLAETFAPAPPPPTHSVVATDGSVIAPDRHGPIRFHVINTGHAVLTYGPEPKAELDSAVNLCFEDDDLYIAYGEKDIPIDGARLGLAMSIAEIAHLAECTENVGRPLIGLIDGSLILWSLQNERQQVQDYFLPRFLNCLTAIRALKVPLASYISFPGGKDVCNALRFELCTSEPVSCRSCSLPDQKRELCYWLGRSFDRVLFGDLQPGHRTDVFAGTSHVLSLYESRVSEDYRIDFFYLNVGGEIARVEVPRWVSSNANMLDLVHSIVYDQCRRSSGEPAYPPALQEAHEQAVISTSDRRLVEQLVERALARRGIAWVRSAKDRSKRRRGV